MNKFLLAILLLSSTCFAGETAKEMYMQNDVGGYVALTSEKCKVEKIATKFPWHAYAVTGDGQKFEGCWDSPSMEGAPKEAIPIVNIYTSEGILHYLQTDFTPNKPEVKGEI